MSEDKKKVELGNPVIPRPHVPRQVGMKLDEQTPKESKGMKEVVIPKPVIVEEKVKVEKEVDAEPKGVITIKLFEESPYEVEFEGMIAGNEMDLAWRAMMKQYRVWKHKVFLKQKEENKGEGDV